VNIAKHIPANHEVVQTATVDLGGRKMLSSRKMLHTDGDGTSVMIDPTQNVLSKFPLRHCPSTNLPWADISAYTSPANYGLYGDLVHDSGICDLSGASYGKVTTTANATGIVSPLLASWCINARAVHVMMSTRRVLPFTSR
jgi:hypothetical protein